MKDEKQEIMEAYKKVVSEAFTREQVGLTKKEVKPGILKWADALEKSADQYLADDKFVKGANGWVYADIADTDVVANGLDEIALDYVPRKSSGLEEELLSRFNEFEEADWEYHNVKDPKYFRLAFR